MEGIDQMIGDPTWQGVEAYPPDRAAVEARRFLADQPHVTRFLNTRLDLAAPVAGAPTDDGPSADEARGSLILLGKTVLDSLD